MPIGLTATLAALFVCSSFGNKFDRSAIDMFLWHIIMSSWLIMFTQIY